MVSADLPRPEIKPLESPPKYEIFKQGQPLQVLGKLGEGITGDAYAIIFDSAEAQPRLSGLGRWVQQNSFLERKMIYQQDSWVENPLKNPQDNPYAAIKISKPGVHVEGQMSIERAIIEDLNGTFSETDQNRPIRLLGYGVTKDERGDVPYLITELVPERFIQVGERIGWTETEIINLATGAAEIFAKMHHAGVIQNDDANLLSNLFYDPTTKEVRLIDFGNGMIKGFLTVYGDPQYDADRSGLGKMMYKMLTGKSYQRNMDQGEFQSSLASFAPETRIVVENLLLRGVEQRYPATGKQGTTIKVYTDLLELQKKLRSEAAEVSMQHGGRVAGQKEAQPGEYSRDPVKVSKRIGEVEQQKKTLERITQIVRGALSGPMPLLAAEDRSIYDQFIAGKNRQQIEETVARFEETQKQFEERIRLLSTGTDEEYTRQLSFVEGSLNKVRDQVRHNEGWLKYYKQHNQLNAPEARKAESDLKVSVDKLRVFGQFIADKNAVER